MKICVCTSNRAEGEPRAPRHAVMLARKNKNHEIIFLDCCPRGQKRIEQNAFLETPNLLHQTYYFPHRESDIFHLFLQRLQQFLSRCLFLMFGWLAPNLLSIQAKELEKLMRNTNADVYIGYSIDLLFPLYKIARDKNVIIIFDCMEFYSDMGDSQTCVDKKVIQCLERQCLSACNLVLASSEEMADELTKVYGIKKPLALYNAPPPHTDIPAKPNVGVSLYWRNSTINIGQRGLDDAFIALKQVPEDIMLHIQGGLPADGGRALRKRIEELNLSKRVFIHPPYQPHEAIIAASPYSIGLCLERGGIRNHELTVSNKIFDYLMAGLAVIASDMPGLRNIVNRSKGGLLFKSGDPDDLAQKILLLHQNRNLLKEFSLNARSFALREGNLEHEMKKFTSAFSELIESR